MIYTQPSVPLLKAIFSVFICCSCFSGSAQHQDSIAVRKTVDNFIQAFNSLSWEPFRNSFTQDATVFFPYWDQGYRKAGIKDIEKTWLQIFPEFNDTSNSLKLNIEPKNLLIQVYGKSAIVTFHLGNGEKYIARRTLVLINENNAWKIAHLHASYIMPEE